MCPSTMAELTSRSLNPPGSFDWYISPKLLQIIGLCSPFCRIYLIEYIVIGLLSLFFLFYFNRLFATIVSYALRLYAWHKFKVYIDIEALQISLLAGRVFFKGVRYHGENVTAFVHSGNLTWRYWLPQAKESPLFDTGPTGETKQEHDTRTSLASEAADEPKQKRLPCRIAVSVSGVEAFCYNRSPSYDFILDTLQRNQKDGKNAGSQTEFAVFSEKSGYERSRAAADGGRSSSTQLSNTPTGNASYIRQLRKTPSLQPERPSSATSAASTTQAAESAQPPSILRLLPVYVHCQTAAVVLGNQNTRSIITAKIESANGEFNASHAGTLDPFRILMDFDVKHPVVRMRPNVDYKESQLAEAVVVKADNLYGDEKRGRRWLQWLKVHNKIKSLNKHHNLLGLSKKALSSLGSVAVHSISGDDRNPAWKTRAAAPYAERWQGLTRYLDDGRSDENEEWDSIEYAKVSTLADIKSLHFHFHWDIPGKIPESQTVDKDAFHSLSRDMNGSCPPAYGMQFIVRGGHVNYGPWADRHRLELQQLFFPMMYADARPAQMLKPGEYRVSTVFDINVLVEDDTVMRIPFREPSKDWKWRGRSDYYKAQSQQASEATQTKSKARKKASGDKHQATKGNVGADVRPFGWFDLKVKRGTSVVYTMDMFPRAEGFKNDLKVDVNRLEIFSSLNHALLWTCPTIKMSCDLSNPLAWRALREWQFGIRIGGLDFFLLRDHTFLLVDLIEDWTRGPQPEFYTFVPFRYLLNVQLDNLKLFLNVNDANIVNHSDELEENDFVILSGREVKADLTIPLDRLRPELNNIIFDVLGEDLGMTLRMPAKNTLSDLVVDKNLARLPTAIVKGVYTQCTEVGAGKTDTLVMDIIGNGLDLQFYGFFGRQLVKIKENYFGEDMHFKTAEEYQKAPLNPNVEEPMTKSNDLDTILNIAANDAKLQLPSGLYDSVEHVWLKVDVVNIDIRVNNYFLELAVDSSPIELGYAMETIAQEDAFQTTSGTELFIESVNVSGHRLFGVGKGEPTYLSTWDVDAGAITSRSSSQFLSKLVATAQSLALTIEDAENALPIVPPPPLHDRTYVRFGCPLIQFQSEVEQDLFAVTIKQVHGAFNDAVDDRFSQKVIMNVPSIEVASVDARASARREVLSSSDTLAYLQTSVSLTVLQRAADFPSQKDAQRNHVAQMDVKGRRATFIYDDQATDELFNASIPLPLLPHPLRASDRSSTPSVALEMAAGDQVPPRIEPPQTVDHSNITSRVRDQLSSFATAYKEPFSTTRLSNLNLGDVPTIEPIAMSAPLSPTSDASSDFFNPDFADDAAHTSVIVSIAPGITGYLTPRAVHGIATALDQLSSTRPERIFDELQIATMTEVVASLSKDQGTNSILDLGFRLPRVHLRLLNKIEVESIDGQESSADQWDFQASDIAASVRLKQLPQRSNESDSVAVHLTTGLMSVEARPVSVGTQLDHIPFRMTIDDVLVWLVDGDRTSVHVSFQALEARLASKQVEYLANLVHRTTVFADGIQARFADISLEKSRRQQLLVYKLTEMRNSIPDPSFLMRPAYSMGQAGEQIRSNDSWKILARLRHTLINLNKDERLRLAHQLANGTSRPPDDAEAFVLASLDSWRSWEAINVRESYAMRIVYGNSGGVEKLHDRSKIPLSVKLNGGNIKAIVDPGSRQNILAFDGLVVALSVEPPPPASAVELFQEYSGSKSTTVQINTTNMSLHINWDIWGLVDRTLRLFERTELKSHPFAGEVGRTSADFGEAESLHVVLASRRGLVSIESPSLTQTYTSNGLKFSVCGTVWAGEQSKPSINGIIHAESTEVLVCSGDRTLMHGGLQRPSVWVAFDRTVDQGPSRDVITIMADSEQVVWRMTEEVQGLVEVTNSIITDEVRYIKQLIDSHVFGKNETATPSTGSERSPKSDVTIRLAVFLNTYDIGIALTQDLTYVLHGEIARVAIAPDLALHSAYVVDLDLKKQLHQIQTSGGTSAGTIEMPPINGSAMFSLTQQAPTISLSLSVEEVMFDGSVLLGLANTMATEQTTTAISAITEDVSILTSSIESVFAARAKPIQQRGESFKPSQVPVFDTKITLAGISVIADAPADDAGLSNARISVFTGPIHSRVSNRSRLGTRSLPFPEFQLSMQKAGTEILRFDKHGKTTIGSVAVASAVNCIIEETSPNFFRREVKVSIYGPTVLVDVDTAPTVIAIASHLQSQMEALHLDEQKKYFNRLRRHTSPANSSAAAGQPAGESSSVGLETNFEIDLHSFTIIYRVADFEEYGKQAAEDLSLTLQTLNLTARSSREARMQVTNLIFQLSPRSLKPSQRSGNSATFPEALFHVTHRSSTKDRQLKFFASGRALEVWLDPRFIVPVKALQASLSDSVSRSKRMASKIKMLESSGLPKAKTLGTKTLSHLVVDAKFAGAVISVQSIRAASSRQIRPAVAAIDSLGHDRGRYGQFSEDDASGIATLRAPGVGLKVELIDDASDRSSLNVELRVNQSNNGFSPTVVPIILELSDSIKQVVDSSEPAHAIPDQDKKLPVQRMIDDEAIVKVDPTEVLGKMKLNVGFRICKQEFTLSCHPIAKVAATASIEDIYLTVNTVDSDDHGHFFAVSALFKGLQLSLKHDFSREATFGFNIESIMMSLMNSKHISGMPGVSAILRVNPTRTHVNAKQLQDILLFREIWLPQEMRSSNPARHATQPQDTSEYFVHRYQQLTENKKFRWNATVAIAEMCIDLDLGQAIGKVSLGITNLWASSRKSASSQQTLCIGIDNVFANSSGRMSGLVELRKVHVRTSIAWPSDQPRYRTPLIQGSVGFDEIRIKTAFDYQLFAVAHITGFEFIMYNVRDIETDNDRLVAILDGSTVNAYCTSSSAALSVALYQAFERLVQEKRTSYEQALQDIERYLHRRRRPTDGQSSAKSSKSDVVERDDDPPKQSPGSLRLSTDVVVSLRALDLGAFPGTFFDTQLVRLNASDVQAGFNAMVNEHGSTESGLGLTLGKVSAALASVPTPIPAKPFAEVSIEEVVKAATSAGKGVILGVPKIVASMHTWQAQGANVVDYIFRSTFDGKIDVGWNYARISYIRGMWANHTRALAARLGKPLPESAVRLTGAIPASSSGADGEVDPSQVPSREEQKITAVVNLPQSKYQYRALMPPIIDTPQLRDMGEATPPLEWVGLQRDRLPNVTHQIVIVALLEVAREVEDAYTQILGSAAM